MDDLYHGMKKQALTPFLFIIQILLNWAYMACVYYQSNTISSAWITLLPLFSYFYFVFALLAAAELFRRTRLGLSLAFGVLLFGIVSDVMTYSTLYEYNNLYELMILPLIAINFSFICYLIFNQGYYKSS
jgi:hypothetical protein